MGLAFLVLAGVSYWRGHQLPPRIFASLGALLLVAGVVAPARLGPVERAWMMTAHAISRVTTPLFMGLIYFVLFTPVGLLRRALGRNALVRPRGARTFWHERPEGRRRSDLHRQF